MVSGSGDKIIIYHNPACGTSRKVLGLIRTAGFEPEIIEYLQTPPSRQTLQALVKRMGVPLRAILRKKAAAFAELNLGRSDLTDEDILDAIEAHPVLIERPIVVSPRGAALCRPPEAVAALLP